MSDKILIATTNPAKFEEASAVLKELGASILGLNDFADIKPIEETGSSFYENAVLKAKGYYDQTKMPAIADDGGFVVDFLGGLPGVHSHRWIGHEASDEELANEILKRMDGIPKEKRTARLGGFIAYYDGTRLLTVENWIEGYVADRLMGEIKPGFPYRPLLMIPQFHKPYSELTHEEHEQVNFRRKSLRELIGKIKESGSYW